jgi:hypothetical protein
MRSKTARGMAIAGLVCSILTFALWIGAYIVLTAIGAAASSGA